MAGIGDFVSSVGGGALGGGLPGLASGLISFGVGALQRGSANKWLRKNTQPIEQIPDEVLQNQRQAQAMASQGLPSEQYNQAMRNIQRQQMSAMRYANDRRGALGSLPYLLDASNNATGNLDALNAQTRIQNQRYAMGINNQVAGWKGKLFQQNQLQPYLRNYQYRMGELGAGDQNLVGGLDKIASAGLGYLGGYGGDGNNGTTYESGLYGNAIQQPDITYPTAKRPQ